MSRKPHGFACHNETAPTAEALKPCPFCGGRPYPCAANGLWTVDCRDCCAEGSPRNDRADAIAAWNRRALSAVPDDGLGSSLRDTHRAPDGWVLVPKDPSEAMMAVGQDVGSDAAQITFHHDDLKAIWIAMLQAAPSPSVPTGDAEGAVVGLIERVRIAALPLLRAVEYADDLNAHRPERPRTSVKDGLLDSELRALAAVIQQAATPAGSE